MFFKFNNKEQAQIYFSKMSTYHLKKTAGN